VAHLHINRFKASCVSREQDLQANSLRLKITTKKSSLQSVRQISRQKPAKASVVRQPKKVYCEMSGMGAKSITIVRIVKPTISLLGNMLDFSKLFSTRFIVRVDVTCKHGNVSPFCPLSTLQ
jgi:hypothetical protein